MSNSDESFSAKFNRPNEQNQAFIPDPILIRKIILEAEKTDSHGLVVSGVNAQELFESSWFDIHKTVQYLVQHGLIRADIQSGQLVIRHTPSE